RQVFTRPGPERFSGLLRVCAIWSLAGGGAAVGRLGGGRVVWAPGGGWVVARRPGGGWVVWASGGGAAELPGDPVAGPQAR
ncbi:hypothetical protein ACFU66_38625, partial [Streptomyces libani]